MNILLRGYIAGAAITAVSNGIYIGYKEVNQLRNYPRDIGDIVDKSTDIACEIIGTGVIRGGFWPIYVPVLCITYKKID